MDAAEVIGNPLPDDVEAHQVTGIVVVTEFLDGDGHLRLGYRGNVPSWRALGMLEAYAADCRAILSSQDDD